MTYEEIFDQCKGVAGHLDRGRDRDARNVLIKMLARIPNDEAYPEILNHFIRETGLYPYMQEENLSWQDMFLLNLCRYDVGAESTVVLHREQTKVLGLLLEGQDLAISAPTSFGKSFIIDAYIRLKSPRNVVIIVPTIALTDETRRRLFKKFAKDYNIITTPDSEIGEKNIFIFPQERALLYVSKLESIDFLVVDEFYKASPDFDQERAHPLIRAILLLGAIAKQRYFLAPNISALNSSSLTEGMTFVKIDFNTVFTNIVNYYRKGMTDSEKFEHVLPIIAKGEQRTLIYAGTYANIRVISDLVEQHLPLHSSALLKHFANWLTVTYGEDYHLPKLMVRGVGLHNGRLHRSLSQLQVKLFEEEDGINTLVSTSSIIEGVNTSAENVVIWTQKNGRVNLNNFTYKNIVGRSGRMFRHFIGNVYLLDKMPDDEQTELNLVVEEEDLCNLPGGELIESSAAITNGVDAYRSEMSELVGKREYEQLLAEGQLLHSKSTLIRSIASDIKNNTRAWRSLRMLNSNDSSTWDNALYIALNYTGNIGIKYSSFVEFIKIISMNWQYEMPFLMNKLKYNDIDINTYFDLEKNATYKLSTTLKIINTLMNSIRPQEQIDVSVFVSKLSSAFLPSTVYQLEEYGLPRSLSRKIQKSGLFNFEGDDVTTDIALKYFKEINPQWLKSNIADKHVFEDYIIDFFYEGIVSPNRG